MKEKATSILEKQTKCNLLKLNQKFCRFKTFEHDSLGLKNFETNSFCEFEKYQVGTHVRKRLNKVLH